MQDTARKAQTSATRTLFTSWSQPPAPRSPTGSEVPHVSKTLSQALPSATRAGKGGRHGCRATAPSLPSMPVTTAHSSSISLQSRLQTAAVTPTTTKQQVVEAIDLTSPDLQVASSGNAPARPLCILPPSFSGNTPEDQTGAAPAVAHQEVAMSKSCIELVPIDLTQSP